MVPLPPPPPWIHLWARVRLISALDSGSVYHESARGSERGISLTRTGDRGSRIIMAQSSGLGLSSSRIGSELQVCLNLDLARGSARVLVMVWLI